VARLMMSISRLSVVEQNGLDFYMGLQLSKKLKDNGAVVPFFTLIGIVGARFVFDMCTKRLSNLVEYLGTDSPLQVV
jgi:hypothetical protein